MLCLLVGSQVVGDHVRVPVSVGDHGSGAGTFPVVEVAGLGSRGATFDELSATLRRDGVPVLDLDPRRRGQQPLVYAADGDPDVAELARDVVGPAVLRALRRAGYAADQRVDVVAHSTGGLAMRYLVATDPGWARRVDDLVMVATPNHGSTVVWLETRGGRWSRLGDDMRPGSALLHRLGDTEPAGETYTTVGGAPLLLAALLSGAAFDDQVPATSPSLRGASNSVAGSFHGQLLRNPAVIDLVVEALRRGGQHDRTG